MSSGPKRQSVIVGLFVALALAILAGGILMVGSLNDTFSRKVVASATFQGVDGLTRGDNIWFSGVKVGTVSGMRFDGVAQVQVDLSIDENAAPYIRRDAQARISSDGLIGNKIIVLEGGSPDAPAISDGDVLTVVETVSTEDIMATFQENNENLLAVTTDLKQITAGLAAGEGSVGRLLKDDALYDDVKQTVSTLQAASTDARAMTSSLAGLAADMNRDGHLVHDLANDDTTYARLTGSVDQLHAASEDAATMMDGLAGSINDPGTPVGTLLHDREAGTDLKGTLDNLERGSELLAEDLEALQHNFLFRGYFKKKRKAEEKAAKEQAAPERADGSAAAD